VPVRQDEPHLLISSMETVALRPGGFCAIKAGAVKAGCPCTHPVGNACGEVTWGPRATLFSCLGSINEVQGFQNF